MWSVIKKNPISTFAVLCVAISGLFVGYMIIWQTGILTSPDWCKRAMGAEKVAPGQTTEQTLEALKSCNSSLLVQLNAIATDSHIDHTVIGIVVVVLIVVVVAGARASWKLSTSGFEGSVARHDDPTPTVTTTTTVAPSAAPVPTAVPQPVPEHKGPAMPEPKP